MPITIPYALYFAGSSGWGGAPCFLDLVQHPAAPTRGRAYLITWEQFEDVVAQENGRPSTTAIDLAMKDLPSGSGVRLGVGRYENVLCLEAVDDVPVVTITSPWAMTNAELGAPSPAYLRVMIAGLRESHAMSDKAIADYLGSARGCSEELVRAALTPANGSEG